MKKTILYFLIFLVVVLAACNRKMLAPLFFTQEDNGKVVHIKKGQVFTIRFSGECIGCAKIWKLTSKISGVTKLINEEFEQKSCKDCVGGTRYHQFTFKVIKTGSEQLEFQYFDKQFKLSIEP